MARIMVIDQAVRAGAWPNATTLARELEVDTRTIRRDITYLRDQLRAPIAYDACRNGYHYTEPSYRLAFFQVSEGELVSLMLAQRLLRQYRGTPFEAGLHRVFAKIRDLLPSEVSVELDTLADCLAVLPPVQTDYNPEVFARLARALTERRRVQVVYHTLERDATTKRTLNPYHLVLRGEDWYLLAQDSHRDAVRTFAVQRVRSVRLLPETFERPADFDVSRYLSDSFRVICGDGHHEVALRFRPPTARRIAEKTWHPTQTIEHDGDHLILRFTVGDLREVKRWVMFWGADCQVLGPEELQSDVEIELKRMLGTRPLRRPLRRRTVT